MSTIYEKLGEFMAKEIIKESVTPALITSIASGLETEIYEIAARLREDMEKKVGASFVGEDTRFEFAVTCEGDVRTAIARELLVELKSWFGEI